MSAPGELVREVLPEPGRSWVRYAPRHWPAASAAPWIDLASGGLGPQDAGPEAPEETLRALEDIPLDDVLYLPPVPPSLAVARDRLARAHLTRGTPVVAQLLPGDPSPAAGVVAALDLLGAALEGGEGTAIPWPGESGDGGGLPGSASRPRVALWPLLPGRGLATDSAGLVRALALAGVTALLSVPLDLPSRDRRRLAQELADEDAALALFHAAPQSPLAAARGAVEQGFAPWAPRPLPRPPLRGSGNLRLAAALAVAGELSLLRQDPPSRAQAFLRAARWAERSPHDLEAVVREGNVAVLHWLEEEPRQVLVAAVGRDPEAVLAGLLATGLPTGEASAGGRTVGAETP